VLGAAERGIDTTRCRSQSGVNSIGKNMFNKAII
jgi:hypothetical protein